MVRKLKEHLLLEVRYTAWFPSLGDVPLIGVTKNFSVGTDQIRKLSHVCYSRFMENIANLTHPVSIICHGSYFFSITENKMTQLIKFLWSSRSVKKQSSQQHSSSHPSMGVPSFHHPDQFCHYFVRQSESISSSFILLTVSEFHW